MRVQLTGGAYQASSLIASAQRCINLYPEAMTASAGEPTRVTHYPTPGLRLVGTMPNGGPIRGMFRASNDELYVVSGNTVYFVDTAYNKTSICTLISTSGFVSMMDNTINLIVIDGSVPSAIISSPGGGYSINLATRVATHLGTTQGGNLGSQRVDYLSTFFIFNQQYTPNFYVSRSLSTVFDPLDFAAKSAQSDYLVAAVVARGQLWLLGKDTSEIWTLSGAADFQFQYLQGATIEHGCASLPSIAKADGQIFWLSRDKQGRNIVLRGSGYEAKRISTHAIEGMLSSHDVTDALGYCYQLNGHVFYVLTLPVGDLTIVFDEATSQWHQWASYNADNLPHRHRSNCFAFWNNTLLTGDFENGKLYAIDPGAFTDAGQYIKRVRSFPHMIDDDKRIVYQRFVADMDVAQNITDHIVQLRYSDDRGATWGAPVTQTTGATGETYTSVQFRRLGMARDRVFELSWTTPASVALNGAFIDLQESVS